MYFQRGYLFEGKMSLWGGEGLVEIMKAHTPSAMVQMRDELAYY